MRRSPIRIRTFLFVTVLFLLVVPTLAGSAAWFIERDHQKAGIHARLNTAASYLTAHRTEMQESTAVHGFTTLLARLGLLAQVVSAQPNVGKSQIYVSPALERGQTGQSIKKAAAAPANATAAWVGERRLIAVPGKAQTGTTLVTDLFYRPASRTTRALVALSSGIVMLLAGLGVAVWLAGRWMVAPLARLSAQVDKVAGGDLAIAVPRSRIGEVANIAQAVEGMTAALGETALRRAEADEARRFLVTSIAHDLRTPLFALRGHLQAISSRLGDPGVHLQRAEARADALERLIGNLFAYSRDDYTQPAPHLEAIPVADLVNEVAEGLEHASRLQHNAIELNGDETLAVIVDRDRLKRALTNIVDNALRYSPPGAPIRLSWSAADDSTVQITVHDQGPGIDPDLLPHIFEPGIRGTAATGSTDSGAGIGLTIAKRLLEHQHATLTVQNHGAGGAVITLVLQRAPSANPS